MLTFELEFETLLDLLDKDARRCATFGYTRAAMDHVAAEDPEVLEQLREHSPFWIAVQAALQSATIVSLGRVFDDTRNVNSADSVLHFAERHRGIFSPAALRARRVRNGNPAEMADAVASRAYAVTPESFRLLRDELNRERTAFKSTIEPIRNQVFAHTAKITPADRDALFGNLRVRELERLLVFPLRLHRALWQLYHNGRKPVLREVPSRTSDIVRQRLPKSTTTWEHQHAAHDAADFFRRLRVEASRNEPLND